MLNLFMILYSIMSNTEAISLVRNNRGVKIEELSSVAGVSYKISDERVIILPVNGEYSLLFKNTNDYRSFLLLGDFPKYDKNPFIRFGNQLSKSENFQVIINEFSNRLGGVNFENDSKNSVDITFDALNEISARSNYDLKEELIPIGLFLGDYLVKHKGFEWRIEREIFQFTPYFLPIVEYKNGLVFNLWAIVENIVQRDRVLVGAFFREVDSFIEDSDSLTLID